jgi:hypothetical protein
MHCKIGIVLATAARLPACYESVQVGDHEDEDDTQCLDVPLVLRQHW